MALEQGSTATPHPQHWLECLDQPACLLDDAGRIVHLNPAWRHLAGVAADTGLASWTALLSPEDRAEAQLRFPSHAGGNARFPCRLKDADGGARWFLLSLQPVRDTPDIAWLCICVDIHDLKSHERELEARSHRQAQLLDICQDCIKLISPAGELIYMNRMGCQTLDIPDDSRFGMAWLPLLPQDVRQSAQKALVAAREGMPSRFIEYSRLPGPELKVWDNSLAPVLGPDGRTTAILCTSRDITAERSAQDALRQSQERLVVASRVGGLGIWDYDIVDDVLFCDETWYRIMGRDPDAPIRCIADFRPLVHPEDVDRATEVRGTASELIAQNRDYAITFRIVRPDGDIRWVRSAACLVQDLSGNPVRAIGFVVDITDTLRGEMALRDANRLLAEERDSLAQQCMEDPLTRIANRRYLDSELVRICRQADAGRASIAVAMIDIDHFKAYNDHYGHPEGDKVLHTIAAALKACARQTDFVARYGGEEFVFILQPANRPAEVFERLVAAIEALAIPHAGSPHSKITISCGYIVQCRGLEPAALLKAADEALYRAKAAGGNRPIVRQPPANRAHRAAEPAG